MTPPPASRRDALLVLAFALLLALPLVGTFAGLDRSGLDERRALSPLPGLPRNLAELATFPAQFESWQRDHFGFRSLHIYWVSKLQLSLFNLSASELVVVGKDGWLFHTNDVSGHQPGFVLPDGTRETWRALLISWNDRLARRGIRFFLMIAPDKSDLLPEMLPDRLAARSLQSPYDQLIASLPERVGLIDLRRAMRASGEQLYFKTDHHWNSAGALFAARALLAAVGGPVPLRSDYGVKQLTPSGGDLARALGLQADLREPDFRMVRATPLPKPGSPRIVMIHDSFGVPVDLFLQDLVPEWGLDINRAAQEAPVFPQEAAPKVLVLELAEYRLRGPPELQVYEPEIRRLSK